MGAIADACADERGIAWPASVVPWKLAILSLSEELLEEVGAVQRAVGKFGADEVVVDDRYHLGLGKRMSEAELVGYGAVLVLGRKWKQEGTVEVFLRRSKEMKANHPGIEEAMEVIEHNV